MNNNLFQQKEEENVKKNAPLADRLRPQNFSEFYGQEKIIGEKSSLRSLVKNDNIHSLIFWGPPGTGKTALAKLIAQKSSAVVKTFSAVNTSVSELREYVEKAVERLKVKNQKNLLIIDEIHRFNKAQQDFFLPFIEKGLINIIGATTENPAFEINNALLSRSSVYVFDPLSEKDLKKIIKRALRDKENGLGKSGIKITKEALNRIVNFADGDARTALNTLESASELVLSNDRKKITVNDLEGITEQKNRQYDKKNDQHYNIISAFIKSMRASDVNAALYWLARMIIGGEDPLFIARRMLIFASEDIGNADPQAIQIAAAVSQAVQSVGLPEAEINLAHGVTYLAQAPKSRAVVSSIEKAKEDAQKGAFEPPTHLKNKDYRKLYGQAKKEVAQDKQSNFPSSLGNQKYYPS